MEKILVVRFSSLGDVVLTAPVIAQLRLNYPNARIDYLVHARFSPAVNHFRVPPDAIIPFPESLTAKALPLFARDISKNDYDLLIDLHNSMRSKILRSLIRAKVKRVYRKPRLKRAQLFYLWQDRFKRDFSLVGEYLRYAGLDRPDPLPLPEMVADERIVALTQAGHHLPNSYLAVIPGAAWSQKVWPAERYETVITSLLATTNEQLLIVGGPSDNVCDEIAAQYSTPRVMNLKGQTSLDEALAIVAGAKIVIGADTGLLHAAQAFGNPAVMILGATSWQTGATTHHPESVTHEVDLWCRPCSQNGSRRCYRKERFCLTGTTPESVVESVMTLLGGRT